MNDDLEKLKSALGANVPQPSPQDRDRAVAAAMAAFDRHHQGIRGEQRQKGHVTERGTSWLRRISMPFPRRPYLAVAGAAAVLIIAVGVGYLTFLVPSPGNLMTDTVSTKRDTELGKPLLELRTAQNKPAAEMSREAAKSLRPPLSVPAPASSLLSPAPPPSAARVRSAAREPSSSSYPGQGRDRFAPFDANPVKVASEDPVSTFSIDVDTASYAFMRASLNRGVLPPRNAVRTEELINYFPYGYAPPENPEPPFAVHASLMPTPWNGATRLMHIGIKGYVPARESRPRANLVFLIDTSGSMRAPNKLPLLKNSLKLLLGALAPDDRVAVVTYAGSAGTVLAPARVAERARIAAALERLGAGGSTAGAEGIRQAYLLAEQHFVQGGINRVILATDGDFNVGITDPEELEGYVARKRAGGVFLSVLGFGTGNYNDALMQRLAQNGNGNAAYIDSLSEARKVLVDEATSTLFPIAKDVKIQVEFNPTLISEYRLIGYETRMLKREDFRNDKVDAGEIGAGHTVTALYEITLAGSGAELTAPLRYGRQKAKPQGGLDNEFATISIRYKKPDAESSALIARHVTSANAFENADDAPRDVRFVAAVAAFGQLLRGGRYTGNYGYDEVISVAQAAKGEDPFGYRAEFIGLVRLAKSASAMEPLRRP